MTAIRSHNRTNFGSQLLSELRDQQQTQTAKLGGENPTQKTEGVSFLDHLESGIKGVNANQKMADKAATDLATGKSQNIHETMLASSQAEITFNLMVQVRNKALQAYQEVMRMPV